VCVCLRVQCVSVERAEGGMQGCRGMCVNI